MTSQVSLIQTVKKFYPRFRIALMAFTLGLAGVYMSERVPREFSIDLPTTQSASVFSVFTSVPPPLPTLRPERNCGKDPVEAQTRIACANERLFGTRDMSLYARYTITCTSGSADSGLLCDHRQISEEREAVWRHWKEKTRAHIVTTYLHPDRRIEAHYFIEPSDDSNWQLVCKHKHFKTFLINGRETEVGMVDDDGSPYPGSRLYREARWEIADDDHFLRAGTRYLQFENETGDTVWF